jgi:hypothetical protein
MILPDGEVPVSGIMIVGCESGSTYVSWPCVGNDVSKPQLKTVLKLMRDAMHILICQLPEDATEQRSILLAHGKLPFFPPKVN